MYIGSAGIFKKTIKLINIIIIRAEKLFSFIHKIILLLDKFLKPKKIIINDCTTPNSLYFYKKNLAKILINSLLIRFKSSYPI